MSYPTSSAQAADELAAIRQTALDYAEGWYEGDEERMRRSLHPNLAKRSIYRDTQTGACCVNETTYQEMVDDTRNGGGSRVAAGQRTYKVTILDVYGNIACVRVNSYHFVDYLHLARWEGRWVIMNALYARNLTNR